MVRGTGLWRFGFSVFRGTGFRVRGFAVRCVGLGLSMFRVWEVRGFGYVVRGSGTGFPDSGLWVWVFVVRGCGGLGFSRFGVSGTGSWYSRLGVSGPGFRGSGFLVRGFRGSGFRVRGFWFSVKGF